MHPVRQVGKTLTGNQDLRVLRKLEVNRVLRLVERKRLTVSNYNIARKILILA